MKRFFFLLLLLCTIVACGTRPAELRRTLEDVASFIEDRPDSAYAVLDAMDREALSTRALRARHAILYSMALDKNYIDLTTDSIINVAYNYYRHHGTPDDKLKTGYYLARIYENRGEMAKAMAYATISERWIRKAEDKRTAGRLYSLKGKLYYQVLDYGKSLENSIQASGFFESDGFDRGYIMSLSDITDNLIALQRFDEADDYLSKLEHMLPAMNSFQEGNYYALRINRYIAESRYFEGLALAEQYLESSIEVQNKPWIETALLYIKFNEYDSARQCLEEYKNSNPSASENIKFNLACSELYHQTKEYEKMMSYYEHYLNLYNGMMVGSLKQGTGFSEMEVGLISRIRTEQTKNQLFILLVLLLALLTIALVLFFIHKIRFAKFEQKEIEARNKQLLSIYQAMKEESKKHDPLSGNVQSDNIELLDKICIIGLTGNGRMFRDSEALLKLVRKDKEELFKTINLMFSLHHSEFIEYLRERGLSEREIACSCLYVLGLQGKELDIYGSPRTTYRINGEIRKKLGLTSHDAPLPQYLSELLKSHSIADGK